MTKENVTIIRGNETFDLGVSASQAARILNVSKGAVRSILERVGIEPDQKTPAVHLYDSGKVSRLAELRKEFPPVSGKRWNPPQELLDRFDLP